LSEILKTEICRESVEYEVLAVRHDVPVRTVADNWATRNCLSSLLDLDQVCS